MGVHAHSIASLAYSCSVNHRPHKSCCTLLLVRALAPLSQRDVPTRTSYGMRWCDPRRVQPRPPVSQRFAQLGIFDSPAIFGRIALDALRACRS